jgi:tight adherence protein C
MMSILPDAFASTPILLAFFGAVALVVSGGTLIASGVRIGHEAVTRRVDMVKPQAVIVPKVTPYSIEKRAVGSHGKDFSEREELEIIRRLSKLGIPAAQAFSYFTAGRALAAGVFGGLVLLAVREVAALSNFPFAMPLAIAFGAIVGWLLPPMFIKASASRRAKAVGASMPEALDLLVICVDAGLSLENALTRVVTELAQSRPALADELAMTSADLQILPSREDALMRMADRVDVPSIRSVVTTLAQTLRYGTPLAQALRVIAAEMRDEALIQLEERANQLPALLTVPMMLFIMPTIFLVVGGPAALQLIDILGQR